VDLQGVVGELVNGELGTFVIGNGGNCHSELNIRIWAGLVPTPYNIVLDCLLTAIL